MATSPNPFVARLPGPRPKTTSQRKLPAGAKQELPKRRDRSDLDDEVVKARNMVKEAKKLQRAKMVELKKEEKKRQRLTAKT